MQTVNERNAKSNDLDVDYGAYVADSDPEGPAVKAGIQEGDIIVSINGKKISSSDEVLVEVRSHSIGDTVEVGVIRDGESKTTHRIARRPTRRPIQTPTQTRKMTFVTMMLKLIPLMS